jgi:hypothetical protein
MTLVVERFVERTHIAYFSREIALRPEIQTYSGGPGVLRGRLTCVFLPNYDMKLAQAMVSDVDVRVTRPAPMKASGISGMKAALNRVLDVSVFDGWWIEACLEGVTGRSAVMRTERAPKTPTPACHMTSWKERLAAVPLGRPKVALDGEAKHRSHRLLLQ